MEGKVIRYRTKGELLIKPSKGERLVIIKTNPGESYLLGQSVKYNLAEDSEGQFDIGILEKLSSSRDLLDDFLNQ